MTASQIIACAISWTAAIVAITALVKLRRTARQIRAERHTFTAPDGGVITFDRRLTDAEVEEFKARWQAAHGTPGAIVELRDEEEPGA